MGNCCLKHGSNMVWAGDDDEEWECVVAPKTLVEEKEKLLSDNSRDLFSSSSSSSSSTINYKEVKIRISKKELEKMLGKIENMEEVTMDQLLSGFLSSSNNSFECENFQVQRSWRPRLQSIPEVD
ncbi:PREDICTED: uncharacterized protein LOC109240508 [Nicotiana attenuata]|uniref:Uncharacterized protein n=1 Tax=Nicotiana attenuata TaxID=49451 RepID=A0A314L996_NICAT|nr:PREDICTED: uncharacterized protein LOC109240508 [Nicotiana attenuata]OIT37619.1 hypothetical protein A4A49_36639 [Nicotiana attenuata]